MKMKKKTKKKSDINTVNILSSLNLITIKFTVKLKLMTQHGF